jgi:hypothetical protein
VGVGHWLKTDHATWRQLKIRDEEGFKKWLDEACYYFPVMQRISDCVIAWE